MYNINQFLLTIIPVTLLIKVKVKDKVVPVLLFLTEHHAMKAYWGVEL
jgi:hypothetical protein